MVRDDVGLVKLAGVFKFHDVQDMVQVGLLANLHDLETAHTFGLKVHTVENDSALAISKVEKMANTLILGGLVLLWTIFLW